MQKGQSCLLIHFELVHLFDPLIIINSYLYIYIYTYKPQKSHLCLFSIKKARENMPEKEKVRAN